MTATPSSEARAEAERRWPTGLTGLPFPEHAAFIAGAEWKGAQYEETIALVYNALDDETWPSMMDAVRALIAIGHPPPPDNPWAYRLGGVESSDEGEVDGEGVAKDGCRLPHCRCDKPWELCELNFTPTPSQEETE